MQTSDAGFWTAFQAAQREAFWGSKEAALIAIVQAEAKIADREDEFTQRRRDLILQLKSYLGVNSGDLVRLKSRELRPLGKIEAKGVDGVSLVTCAMNRTENLLGALPSWLACEEISEILIVDWSSREPVKLAIDNEGFCDARIKVVRVEGEPRWILSYAFNVGFRLAQYSRILKVDADIVLAPGFISRNPLPPDSFIAGNWRKAKDDQAYINGFFYAQRSQLAAVGGFNEYITTYGWDDDDLYDRLINAGAERIDVDPDTLYHQPHTDQARTGKADHACMDGYTEITGSTMYSIRRNRFLANVMPVWNSAMAHIPFTMSSDPSGQTTLHRSDDPVHAVPPQIDRDADYYALLEMTMWRVGREVISLDRAELRTLLKKPFEKLNSDDVKTAVERQRITAREAPSITSNKKKLFIDAQHGLGNRLRAIGSAAAIAEATGRELVIVWQPDDHCDCRLEDLFDYDGAVIDTRFLAEAEGLGCDVYNYMTVEPSAQKDAPIVLNEERGVYARSAFVLNSGHSHWAAENAFIQSLTPVKMIRDLVAGTRHPNDVTAHVRMEGGKQFEHLPYESAENWTREDHGMIAEWRGKSHFAHFMRRLDQLIAEGRADHIFLAADRPETYDEFVARYGDRVAFLSRTAYDRSAEQLRYAMADAILLSRAPLMLGSNWSSFSELAMRLAPSIIEVEMSGKDF